VRGEVSLPSNFDAKNCGAKLLAPPRSPQCQQVAPTLLGSTCGPEQNVDYFCNIEHWTSLKPKQAPDYS